MTKVYACLTGSWVCLNDDPGCTIGEYGQKPHLWWEENAPVFAPATRTTENSMYGLDYVQIHYQDKTYRISPVFIQIVNE